MSDERKTLFPPLPPVDPEAWKERLEDWPGPSQPVPSGLREAAERAEFALSLALGATYDDRTWLGEAMAAADDLRAALATATPAAEEKG